MELVEKSKAISKHELPQKTESDAQETFLNKFGVTLWSLASGRREPKPSTWSPTSFSKESQYFAPSRCPLTRAALSALIRSRIKRPSNLFVSSTSLGMWTNFVWIALSMVSSELRLPSCRRPFVVSSIFSSPSPTSQTAWLAACFEGPSCDAEALRAFLSPARALSAPRFPMQGSRVPARGLKAKWLQTHSE